MESISLKEHQEILDFLLPHNVFLVYQDKDYYDKALAGIVNLHKAVVITKSLSIARTIPGYLLFLDSKHECFIVDFKSHKKGEI